MIEWGGKVVQGVAAAVAALGIALFMMQPSAHWVATYYSPKAAPPPGLARVSATASCISPYDRWRGTRSMVTATSFASPTQFDSNTLHAQNACERAIDTRRLEAALCGAGVIALLGLLLLRRRVGRPRTDAVTTSQGPALAR